MKKLLEAIYKAIKSFAVQYSERSVSAYSAQAAFFLFVSFFPFAVILFYVINSIPELDITLSSDIGFFPTLLTVIVNEAQEQVARTDSHSVILAVSAVAALWTASKGIYGISLGLDSAVACKNRGNAVFARLRAALYTLAFIAIIVVVLALIVFGNMIYEGALDSFPDFALTLFLIRTFRFAVTLLVLIFFFSITYKFLTTKKQKYRDVLPGALLASIGWLIFSYLYSLYIDNYDVTSSVYGSLATIVLLMLWLYFCMNILLFGALVNSWLAEARIEPKNG